jgi:hypothetical protein
MVTMFSKARALEFTAPAQPWNSRQLTTAVFGRYGPVRVRRGGRGERTRFIVAPLSGGELMTCVLRVARSHDLDSKDAFVIPASGGAEKRPDFNRSMLSMRQRAHIGGGRGPELPGLATQ